MLAAVSAFLGNCDRTAYCVIDRSLWLAVEGVYRGPMSALGQGATKTRYPRMSGLPPIGTKNRPLATIGFDDLRSCRHAGLFGRSLEQVRIFSSSRGSTREGHGVNLIGSVLQLKYSIMDVMR